MKVTAVAAALMLWTSTAVAAPLHDAARAGDTKAVLALIEDGADINEQDEHGATPLMAAARAGQTMIIDLLIQRKADRSIRDNDGMTPLHAAVMSGVPTAAWFFIEDMDHGGYIPIDVNDKANALGVTPLIIAAEAGDANLVTYLILYGVDVNATDAKGYTALTRAGPKGDDKLINILLRSHASCQEIDPAWKADCDKRKAALGL